MDQKFLLAFTEYYRAVHQESVKMSKFSTHFINDPQIELVNYHIFINSKNKHYPSQTELIYDLELDAQKIRKIINQSIDLGYVEQVADNDDGRVARYKATSRLENGLMVHATRHAKALVAMSAKVGFFDEEMHESLLDGLQYVVGDEFMHYPAYGEGDLQNIQNILQHMEIAE